MPKIRHQPEPVLQMVQGVMEAGKQRLAGSTTRQVDSAEIKAMRQESEQMKFLNAELTLKNRVLKKSLRGLGDETWDD